MTTRIIILCILLLISTFITVAQGLEISTKNGENIEYEAKSQLEKILSNYNEEISKWIFTKKIIIDKNIIPFSHPVLTLNCNYLDNDYKQLSNFLHEQFHWFVSAKKMDEEKAIKEFKQIFPKIPIKGKLGAKDEYSNYLHLIICDLEFQAMTSLIGEAAARQLLSEWSHYTWIYNVVLKNKIVREINIKHGFIVP